MFNLIIRTLVPYKTYTSQAVHADPIQASTLFAQNDASQLFELSTLLNSLSQKIRDAKQRDAASVKMALTIMTPVVMEWMGLMREHNADMAQVVLDTWAKEHRSVSERPQFMADSMPCSPPPPPSVASVPGASAPAEFKGGAIDTIVEDEDHWSEVESI
jgi:hypothetical protein